MFREKTPLGLIAMRDEPRTDAKDAVRQLTAMGVTSVILTGDNPRTAAAIAGGLGMEFQADMMPEDKLKAIKAMSERGGVMMIGDGINDAPALKQASVGVAMGSGTDVALETADAAILRDRVTDIPATIRLSRAAMANIRQNVTIALGLEGSVSRDLGSGTDRPLDRDPGRHRGNGAGHPERAAAVAVQPGTRELIR